MASDAKIFFQSIMDENSQLIDMKMQLHDLFLEAYDKGARIHNDSWGAPTGSRYTYNYAVVDMFMVEYPEMLIVLAAGNEGVCPPGSGYIGRESLVSPATAKNALTVGASRSNRMKGGYADSTYGVVYSKRYMLPPTSTDKISGDAESLAPFSSRGPCRDDRIKPDIVAPGTDILSTKSSLASLSQFDGGYDIDKYAFMNNLFKEISICDSLTAPDRTDSFNVL